MHETHRITTRVLFTSRENDSIGHPVYVTLQYKYSQGLSLIHKPVTRLGEQGRDQTKLGGLVRFDDLGFQFSLHIIQLMVNT